MKMRHLWTGAAALALLCGCGSSDTGSNIVTHVETDNDAEFVVPETSIANGVADNAAAASTPALNVAPDGVTLVLENGSARHATFGMGRDMVVTMVSAALGQPTDTGRNEECGQGPVDTTDFTGGLSLSFQDGKFVGWNLDGRDKAPYTTASGIGIGSTLKQIRDAMAVTVETSTLGIEFQAGDLSGLLTANAPDGRVEFLWAGSICQFR